VNNPGFFKSSRIDAEIKAPIAGAIDHAGHNDRTPPPDWQPPSLVSRNTGNSGQLFQRAHNPANWVTNVPRYFRVRYRHIYPGIDLIFHGSQTSLEYDFIVSPGADPNHIKLDFNAADSVKIEPNGDLVVTTADGLLLTHHAPIVFQEKNGVRRNVAGSYTIRGRRQVVFQIPSYLRSQTLVIDPVFGYSALFGGSSAGYPFAITADASGNAYVTGNTLLSAFPVLPGSFEAGNTTQDSVFIYELNSSRTDFEYTTFIGGSSGQYGTGIVVDEAGDAYVTGVTSSADFPSPPVRFRQLSPHLTLTGSF
jgi:hypothetical protein